MKERFPELQTLFGPSCLYRGVETEHCFKMEKPKRWSGLWGSGFEFSRFCPDGTEPASKCDVDTPGRAIWLVGAPLRRLPFEGCFDGPRRIDFVGRITQYPGGFGHLGLADYHMVVDRLISIEEVDKEAWNSCEQRRKRLSKAEAEYHRKLQAEARARFLKANRLAEEGQR